MKFRLAGILGVVFLLMVSAIPASAQAEIFIGDQGTLSNGRYTASIDVGFTCEHPDAYSYEIVVGILQPSGRTLAEGVARSSDSCVGGEAISLTLFVDTLAAPFKPGPATVTVDLTRIFCCYDSDVTHESTTVKFAGGNSGTPSNPQSDIVIGDGGILSNGRQTATIDVGFTCDHIGSFGYDITVRVAQPSGQSMAEGVTTSSSPCVGGEAVNVSVSVGSTTTAFKPGPATVIVELQRNFEEGGSYDWVTSHASVTVKFKG